MWQRRNRILYSLAWCPRFLGTLRICTFVKRMPSDHLPIILWCQPIRQALLFYNLRNHGGVLAAGVAHKGQPGVCCVQRSAPTQKRRHIGRRYSSASRFKLSFEGKRLPRSQSLTTLTLTPNSYATRLSGHSCSVRHRFTSSPNCFSKSCIGPRFRNEAGPWGVSPGMRGMGGRRDPVLNRDGTLKKGPKS